MIVKEVKVITRTFDYENGVANVERTETKKTTVTSYYRYDELDDEAKKRAREAMISEECCNPCGHYALHCEELWMEAHRIEELTPIRFKTGYDEKDVWAVVKSNDIIAEEIDDTGFCYSIDLCELWNDHYMQMEALEEAESAIGNGIEDYDRWCEADSIVQEEWDELIESIAKEMATYIRKTLFAEEEYYTSHEFWDEWLSGDDTELFTKDGTLV